MFANLEFTIRSYCFTVVFIYVCLEDADVFVMFACWDFVEPIRYGVCDVGVGVGVGLLQVVPSFASWSTISLSKDSDVCSSFLYC